MIEKGKVVQTQVKGEEVWVKILGTHNSNGLQAQVLTHLENEEFKIGQMFRLDPKDILRELDNSNDD